MAGFVREQGKKNSPVSDMYKIYNSAVDQQAGDYDDIMGRFKQIYSDAGPGSGNSLSSKLKPYIPSLATYDKSPDTTAALANLRGLTQDGGLSGGDQQNLRARGISPIRSMYATAQRDLDRRRNLSGGYSPNYGAVTAKMTRDMSSGIADQMDKVNAGIAEMVQRGKLSVAPQYASASQAESELKNRFELENANTKNEAARFNAGNMFDAYRTDKADRVGATQGMRDLYGTTPALVKTYGDQSMDTANFQNNVNQQKKRQGLSALSGLVRN